jgi:hypothetical protein
VVPIAPRRSRCVVAPASVDPGVLELSLAEDAGARHRQRARTSAFVVMLIGAAAVPVAVAIGHQAALWLAVAGGVLVLVGMIALRASAAMVGTYFVRIGDESIAARWGDAPEVVISFADVALVRALRDGVLVSDTSRRQIIVYREMMDPAEVAAHLPRSTGRLTKDVRYVGLDAPRVAAPSGWERGLANATRVQTVGAVIAVAAFVGVLGSFAARSPEIGIPLLGIAALAAGANCIARGLRMWVLRRALFGPLWVLEASGGRARFFGGATMLLGVLLLVIGGLVSAAAIAQQLG